MMVFEGQGLVFVQTKGVGWWSGRKLPSRRSWRHRRGGTINSRGGASTPSGSVASRRPAYPRLEPCRRARMHRTGCRRRRRLCAASFLPRAEIWRELEAARRQSRAAGGLRWRSGRRAGLRRMLVHAATPDFVARSIETGAGVRNIPHPRVLDSAEARRRFPTQFAGTRERRPRSLYELGGGYVRPERCIARPGQARPLGAREPAFRLRSVK